jgi:hypothetical protein
LSVYSIYKETHSSDGSATPERHYAGWAANQDNAVLRANELYEGRDSKEAVVVIGNGPTEVEVVYRVDGENQGIVRPSVRADELRATADSF